MSRRRFNAMNCAAAQALDQIGDWWTLLIVREAIYGKSSFTEFRENLGIARNIRSGRLARLVQAGIVERTAYREPGTRERHEYRLSGPGRELIPILLAFMGWGYRNLAGPEGPPTVVRHAGCGARIRVSLICEDGHELEKRPSLRLEPGPGSRVRSLGTSAPAAYAPGRCLAGRRCRYRTARDDCLYAMSQICDKI